MAKTSGISPLAGGGAAAGAFALTVTTPAEAILGSFVLLTGTYSGPTPSGIDYSTNGGRFWTPVGLYSAASGLWSGLGPSLPFALPMTVIVRNSGIPAIGAVTSGFQVGQAESAAITTSITIATPGAIQQGVLVPLLGTYRGSAPASLDYSIDAGATWQPMAGLIAAGGSWTASGPVAVSTVPLLVSVRVTGMPAVSARTTLISVSPASISGFETLTVGTPSGLTVATPVALLGTYTGGPPLAMDYALDGVTWQPLRQFTFAGGQWSGVAAVITVGGGYTLRVRDDGNPSVVASTGAFVVTSLSQGVPGLVVGLTAGNARYKSTSSHGCLISSPNINSVPAMALYEQQLTWHVAATGSTPAYMDTFIDYTQARSAWAGNSTFFAASWAASATARRMVPVVGVPLAAASEWSNPMAAYQAVASGAYDSVYAGIAAAWRGAGFPVINARIGFEQNGGAYPWAVGSSAAQVAAWVAAYQRVSTVMRTVSGMTVIAIWNPATVPWTDEPVQNSYPGDDYVDNIGLSIFSPVYPNDLYDWTANNWFVDPDLATWAANKINREHYWNYPSADGFNPLGRSYAGWGMAQHLAFAIARNKPMSFPAVGVGALLDATTGLPSASQPVFDDGDFPLWLSQQAFALGMPSVSFISAFDSLTATGDWRFSDPTVAQALTKPNARAAWRQLFSTYNSVGGTVDLTWSPPSGVAGVFTYAVQYRLSGAANWTPYGPRFTASNVTVGGLAPGSLYDFQVSATNAAGQGPWALALNTQIPTH